MIPINLSAAAIALLAGLTSGAFFTSRYKDYQLSERILAAKSEAEKKEDYLKQKFGDQANAYDQEITALNDRINRAAAEFGRLRVKRCPAVPKAATPAGEADAAATGQADRAGEIEINLDGVAAKINRLGGDLDRANEQIKGLRAVVNGYLTTVNGN